MRYSLEGFIRFVNEVAKENPDKVINHDSWESCAVGDYWRSVPDEYKGSYSYPSDFLDGHPALRMAFGNGGRGYMKTYKEAKEILDVYMKTGKVPVESYDVEDW